MKLIIGLILLIIAGCATIATYNSKGEELYVNKCGGCHRIYNKSEFTKEEWKREVDEMSKKAKLAISEKELILEHLTNDSLHVTKH